MITQELVSYIQKQTVKKTPKNIIVDNLLRAGWRKEDVDEGFLTIESQEKNTEIEIFNQELPKGEKSQTEILLNKSKESPKVWVPMGMLVKEKEQSENSILNTELKESSKKVETINPKYFDTKEELIPTLIPKVKPPEVILPETEIKKEDVLAVNSLNTSIKKNSLAKNLPQSAMLSSYKSDLLLVDRKEDELSHPKKRKKLKSIIFILILILTASLFWYFANGDTNFSFIKKDPKVLLLDNSKNLSSLKSYKTETRIEISSPSFFDISYGLVSGEAISSQEKDFLRVDISGVINQNEGDIFSDTAIIAKGSILENNVFSNIKNDGKNLFISNSSFDQILKDESFYSGFIQMNKNQINSISSLFSPKLESKLNKVDIYKVLSGGLASYLNDENLIEYNDLISKAQITEKGEEIIKGVETYHYSINANSQLFKKLFDKISNNFTQNLSKEEANSLELILGSSTINLFEVWIGKGDNNIYQYSFDVDIPLSKIIGFNDAGIGDSKINLVWKTTYYDFDIINNIIMPEDFIPATDFANLIKQTRVKNEIISFGKLASALFKKDGTYGKNSNSNGDCINPVSGSLFSPLGHTKKSAEEISSISLFLNKILNENNEMGFCYSNSKAWSLTVPVLHNYEETSQEAENIKYYFCVDGTGESKELINPPTGVICK